MFFLPVTLITAAAAALIKDSRNPDAAGLLAFLRGPTASGFFERQGFTVTGKPGASQ